MKCQLRGGRCSKAKGRNRVTDAEMVEWLRRGMEQFPPTAGADLADLARRHMALPPL